MSKNIFQNGDFKDGTRDWTLQTVSTLDSNNWPTGTLSAGAANFTQGLTSSANALEGKSSGQWTKAGVNAQRQGFLSELLQVDKMLQGNVVKFEALYKLTQDSGTLNLGGVVTTHDIKLAIYDVTNSAWIQPSGHLSINSLGINAIVSGEFQLPITTTQLRVFIFQATTSTAGWTIVADQFFIGKVDRVYGSPQTEWKALVAGSTEWPTPGSWTSNVSYTGLWRQVGGDVEFDMSCSVTAPSPGPGALSFNLPAGMAIDTARLAAGASSVQNFGFVRCTSGSGTSWTAVAVTYNSTTSVLLRHDVNGSFDDTSIQPTSPFTFTTGGRINVRFSVPIVGRQTTTILSSDADTRVVAARYTADAISMTDAAIMDFATKDYDTHGAVTTGASWKFTAPIAGKYRISTAFNTGGYSNTVGQYLGYRLFKGGVGQQYACLMYLQTATSISYSAFGTTTINLLAGEYIDLRVNENLTTNPSIASPLINFIEIERVSGPVTIAATERISARYSSNSGQAFPNITTTIVNYEDITNDSHLSVTTGAAWKFVAPAPGLYSVKAAFMLSGSTGWIDGESLQLNIYKNGVQYSQFFRDSFGSASTVYPSITINDEVLLNTGDYIDIRAYQESGASINMYTIGLNNFVNIKRVG